jgi:hypothetical protein
MAPSAWRSRPDHAPRRKVVIAPTKERNVVPRKPNYKFERMERDRAKALKKADRLKAKQERAEQKKAEEAGLATPAQAGVEPATAEEASAED